MKITDRLIGDHKTFRKMLSGLDAIAGQPDEKRDVRHLIRLVELFKDHMAIHAWAEDTFYYPAVRGALPKASPPLSASYMDRLDEEHKFVDGLLDRLELEVKSRPIVADWLKTYALFVKGLMAHMDKEEKELFPISERLLGTARLEELSSEVERRRREAPKVRFHAQT